MQRFFTNFCLYCFAYFVLPCHIFGQNSDADKLPLSSNKGTGTIYKGSAVHGYYRFFKLSDVDAVESNYKLFLYDQNASIVAMKEFTEEVGLTAKEAVNDGVATLVKFRKGNNDTYMVFDNTGDIVFKLRKMDQFKTTNTGRQPENMPENTLAIIEGKGFVDFCLTKKVDNSFIPSYMVNFIPNNKNQKEWYYAPDVGVKIRESAQFLSTDKDIIYAKLIKRKSLDATNWDEYLIGIEVATGKKLFEVRIADDHAKLTLQKSAIDWEGNVQLFGLYYDIEAPSMMEKSSGVFYVKTDKKGEVKDKKLVSWQDKHAALQEDPKKFQSGSSRIYMKELFFTAGDRPNLVVEAGDYILLLNFDEKFTLVGGKTAFKTKRGYVIKVDGSEDGAYKFTQVSDDKSTYSVAFVDQNATAPYLRLLKYAGGSLAEEEVPFNPNATHTQTLNAKTGHVLFFDYFQELKKVEFRLVEAKSTKS